MLNRYILPGCFRSIIAYMRMNMKTKSFQKYLKERLDKGEIAEVERQAKLEVKRLMGNDPKDVFKKRK